MSYPNDVIVLQGQTAPPRDELRRYANLLGGVLEAPGFGDIRVVKYDAEATKSTAQSLAELSLHTDGTFLENPPSRFILSFAATDPSAGGVSTFFPLADILRALPTWVFDALARAEYRFLRTYGGDETDSWIAHVLSQDSQGNAAIRWKADGLLRPEVVRGYGTHAEEAIAWLEKFLETHEPISYLAQTGETIVVPNRATLHGRSSLPPDSPREVLRVWTV
jgi:alpha-ketoglutarate-dependent taurine dioxygenase